MSTICMPRVSVRGKALTARHDNFLIISISSSSLSCVCVCVYRQVVHKVVQRLNIRRSSLLMMAVEEFLIRVQGVLSKHRPAQAS